jgi:poly(3-hydroxyalkanoate) synthetase
VEGGHVLMNENGPRFTAWKDTLSDEELEWVERVQVMPQAMQVAYVYVMLRREIDRVRQPLWKTSLTRLGYVIGGMVAALVGFHQTR